jgi:uncharacterized protein (DUF58 family)
VISDELLKKVKRIEINTRKKVTDLLTGNFKSQFKGQGMQFSEHRVYVAGDDVRHIDWKVTARSHNPVIKKYEEERELSVMLVIDCSGSEFFASQNATKSEVMAELAGMIAYAATLSGDRVGAILFAGEVEQILPAKKGRNHLMRLIRDVLTHEPRTRGTNLSGALMAASRIMKHSGVVFVLSDFLAKDYGQSLKRLARKHDVVAIEVYDKLERNAPGLGRLELLDAESGKVVSVDPGSYTFQKWWQEFRQKNATETQTLLKSAGVSRVEISTEEDYGEALVRFFALRARGTVR